MLIIKKQSASHNIRTATFSPPSMTKNALKKSEGLLFAWYIALPLIYNRNAGEMQVTLLVWYKAWLQNY